MRTTLVAVVLLSGATAWADAKHPNPFLSQAKVFFTQNEGEKCLKRLIQSEKWKFNDKKDRAEIEMYGGMCGYLMGETQAAEISFKRATEYNPKIEPPADISPGIAQLWLRATGKVVKPELAAAAAAEEQAKQQVAAAKPADKKGDKKGPTTAAAAKSDAPQVAAAPVLTPAVADGTTVDVTLEPGVKKRSFVLPVFLGVAAVAGGGVGTYLGITAKSHATAYASPDVFQSDADKLKSQAQGEALGANIAFGVAGALAIGAVAVLIFGG